MDSDPGDTKKLSTIGRYVILDSVGMGGMGLVCAAYDPKLNRKIALKLLRNASNDEVSTNGRNRLFREAQALAKLSHPNVVTVHDVDVFEGQVYIAMEFVEGTTLREWLRERPRTWKEILHEFILAGRGLAAAHQADIIHRDFKPSNVLIGKDGEVRVADFGVAKERDRGQRPDAEREYAEFERRRRTVSNGGTLDTTAEDALIEEIQSNISVELTVAGRMVGTPAYMAPEQHMGLRVGPYTDQYSFCVSFYEALYGRLPFEGVDRRDQLTKMTEGKLPPPPKEGAARHVPVWLYKVLARGLRPHPSERWPSMEALLAALERDPVRRVRRLAIAAVALIGAIAGIIGFVVGDDKALEVNPCALVGDEVEDYWNARRRADIEAAFARSSKPYAADAARRVVATFDRWAEHWRTSKVEVCEATQVTGTQSQGLLDVRMFCLEQRANELDAIAKVFAEADDEIVERSVSAAHDLGDPRACTLVRDTGEFRDRSLDPQVLEQVEAMDAELDRARALASLEKFDESLPLQARVAARAREISHPWTLVRALYELSYSQLETNDVAGGEASLQEVIRLAASLDDAEQEAEAWARLIFYLGSKHNKLAEAHAWTLAAESALVRAGDDQRLRARYLGTLGALALAENDVEVAITRYREALAVARTEYGEDHPQTIRLMMNYAIALARDEQYQSAERALAEAVTRSKVVYGSTHPWLAIVYLNLGNVYIVSAKPEQAEVALRNALEIRERVGGPAAPNLAAPLHALGKVARDLGQLDEALDNFRRAAEIFVKAKGENSAQVAAAVTDIAVIQHRLGRYDDARTSFDRVEAIYRNIYPDGHRHVGGLLERRCEMYIDARQWAAAVADCEAAIAIAERFELAAETRRDDYELLARAERGRGRIAAAERAEARRRELQAQIDAEADAEASR